MNGAVSAKQLANKVHGEPGSPEHVSRRRGRGDLPITELTGPVVDQAALRSLLSKIWDLNLTLISVARVETSAKQIGRQIE